MVIEINAQILEFDAKDIGSFKAIAHLYCIVVQERFMVLLKPMVRVIVYEKTSVKRVIYILPEKPE